MVKMKPIEFTPMTDDLSEELRVSCKPGLMPMAAITVSPSGCAMPEEYELYAERLHNFEVYEDDVWVISYPKCGTTWTQEMVWLIGNNCDFDAASDKLLLQRFPFLEAVSIIPQPQMDERAQFLDEHVLFADTIDFVEEQPSPRFIKSHLPVALLPKQIWTKKPKIIYVTRNPMDAAISYYHHHRLWNGYVGSYETFMEGFLQDKLVYSPFWEHVLEYKNMENQEHVLITSFEEMKADLKGVILRTADFMGKKLSDEQVEELMFHLSFANMKNNPAINGEDFIKEVKEKHDMPEDDPELTFIRKGQVGGWKKEMPHHFVEKFKLWTKEKLRGSTYTEDDFY
uniref:Sulfotransferase domain-containing protein n=1 Tax=Cuerna arida TaxID=1464854 RepID=A0A1B6GG97_9HEMI